MVSLVLLQKQETERINVILRMTQSGHGGEILQSAVIQQRDGHVQESEHVKTGPN